jgi:hypothetical protein
MIFTDTFYYKKMSFLTSTDIFSNWKVSLAALLRYILSYKSIHKDVEDTLIP